VRVLENVIERAMVIGTGTAIRSRDLPFYTAEPPSAALPRSLKELEKMHIKKVLEDNEWNMTRSAKELEIDRQTLYNKVEKYGLKKD